jgi:hypothetical protein
MEKKHVTSMQTSYAREITQRKYMYAERSPTQTIQPEDADKLCRQESIERHADKLCMQREKTKKHAVRTNRQNVQTEPAEKLLQTEHAHFAQAFSNFCNIYAEPVTSVSFL